MGQIACAGARMRLSVCGGLARFGAGAQTIFPDQECAESAGCEPADENAGNRHGHRHGRGADGARLFERGPERERGSGTAGESHGASSDAEQGMNPQATSQRYANHVLHNGAEPEDPQQSPHRPPAAPQRFPVQIEADRGEQCHLGQLLQRAIDVELNPTPPQQQRGQGQNQPRDNRRRYQAAAQKGDPRVQCVTRRDRRSAAAKNEETVHLYRHSHLL